MTIKELKEKLNRLDVPEDTEVYVTLAGLNDIDVKLTEVDDNYLSVFLYTEELRVIAKEWLYEKEKKLEQKKIDFEVNKNLEDILEIASKVNMSSAPLLEVDGEVLGFEQANKYINSL